MRNLLGKKIRIGRLSFNDCLSFAGKYYQANWPKVSHSQNFNQMHSNSFSKKAIAFDYMDSDAWNKQELSLELHNAASKGQTLKVQELLNSAQCPIDATQTYKQMTVLQNAVLSGHFEVAVCLLKSGANVNKKNETNQTALHIAADKGDRAMVQLLLAHGAEINAVDVTGANSLHYAVYSQNYDLVADLVDAGAVLDLKCFQGRSALHLAATCNSVMIAKLLVDRGANINALDDSGVTVLHRAVKAGNLKMVMYLVYNGALVNVKDDFGDTALHDAILFGHLQIAQFLFDNGADVTTQNRAGMTPIDLARDENQSELVSYIKSICSQLGKKFPGAKLGY